MILKDDFFRVVASQQDDTTASYTVTLNPEHFVFKAHFPDNPITPGVLQIGIVEELMSDLKGLPLRVSQISNIKYMNIISPTDNPTFDVVLSRIQQADNGFNVQCVLKREETIITKMSLVLSPKP